MLKNYDVELRGPYWDTMLAHYLLEPELRHNMNYMSETYLQYATVKIEELIGKKGAQQGTMRDVPIEKIKDYAAEDADITIQLRDYLAPKLDAGGPRRQLGVGRGRDRPGLPGLDRRCVRLVTADPWAHRPRGLPRRGAHGHPGRQGRHHRVGGRLRRAHLLRRAHG